MTFPYLGETKELNEITRKKANDSFIKLEDGVTHYELSGVKNAKTVVLVHGFSVPYFIFDPTFEFLCKSGFRVLRYDLFGRGWSDRPRKKYNIHLFVKQLNNLLDNLEITEPVSLMGLSMGGPISASFVDIHSERVAKHILIDPSGAKAISLSLILETAKLPIFGELALGLFGSGNMVKNIASDFFSPELVQHFQEQYIIQMQFKGFKRAILSTMRNEMLGTFYEIYQRIGKINKPTLLFWGKNDKTVPFEDSELILKAIPHAEFHPFEKCGHIPHYEKPELVNPILLKFLSN